MRNHLAFNIFTSVACVIGLLACTKSAPKCGDEETKKLVLEISREQLLQQAGKEISDQFTLDLSGIRTTDFNEKTGKQECAAELVMRTGAGEEKLSITYTSERTDKGDEFYVQVFGL